MPFRAKVKKAFGKSNEDPSETSSDLSQVQCKPSTKKTKKQKVEYPDNVYKPGEIPASKYNGPYDKKHQQKLHAFNFASAFQGRRKSEHSLYSPMGSRLPSRVSSFISRRSFGPRSRQQSRVEDTLMENNEADEAVEDGKAALSPYFPFPFAEADLLAVSLHSEWPDASDKGKPHSSWLCETRSAREQYDEGPRERYHRSE
ncbi:MAG: hypothetical protein Q9179_001240 [Wetmoreana sp. 5 TL-2023]